MKRAKILVLPFLCGCEIVTEEYLRTRIRDAPEGGPPGGDTGVDPATDTDEEPGDLGCLARLRNGEPGSTVSKWRFDDDYRTIQEAIDAANPGDLICVARGRYQESLYLDKPLSLISVGSADDTTVVASDGQPAIVIEKVEGQKTLIQGFTFTQGSGLDITALLGAERWWAKTDGYYTLPSDGNDTFLPMIEPCSSSDDDGYTVGGGVVVYGSKVVHLSDVRIAENVAACEGGGAWIYQSEVTWTGGTITSNRAGTGGGLALRDGALTISDVNFSDNGYDLDPDGQWGTTGGGLAVWDGDEHSTLNATDVTLTGGRAFAGGGLFVQGATINWSGGEISANTARNGGGIYANHARLEVAGGVEFSANTADFNVSSSAGGYGDAIALDCNVQATLQQSTFDGNDGSGSDVVSWGACDAADSEALNISESMFLAGEVGSDGGAIWVSDIDALVIEDGLFEGHRVSGDGGALYALRVGEVEIVRTLFQSNEAEKGGALYAWDIEMLTISDSAFLDNFAGEDGGGLVIRDQGGTLNRVTVAGNRADTSGGGIYLYNSALTLNDSIIAHNDLSYGASGGENLACYSTSDTTTLTSTSIYSNDGEDPWSTISGCTVEEDSEEPLFVEPGFVSFDPDAPVQEWDLHLCVEEAGDCLDASPLLDRASDGGDPGAYGRAGDTDGPPEPGDTEP